MTNYLAFDSNVSSDPYVESNLIWIEFEFFGNYLILTPRINGVPAPEAR